MSLPNRVYDATAAVLAQHGDSGRTRLVSAFAELFAQDNPRFDTQRFSTAARPASNAPHTGRFTVLRSADELKENLELVHLDCGGVITDVEHDDSLNTLLSMAVDHVCHTAPPSNGDDID